MTLLPEYAAQIADAHARQMQQYRLVYAAPEGAGPTAGSLSFASVRSGMKLSVSRTGRVQ
ncbi:MAG: hypothetical protein HY657_05020 [Acidobacteria bacterium]|nr:hypothetical protein [Acidobacteriota bacterium]